VTADDTPTQCLACGGHHDAGGSICPWCDAGLQSPEQRKKWLTHRSGPRAATAMPDKTVSGRFDPHRAVLMGRLAKAWDKRSDLGLVELLRAATEHYGILPEHLLLIDDKRLIELVERFVLLGSSE